MPGRFSLVCGECFFFSLPLPFDILRKRILFTRQWNHNHILCTLSCFRVAYTVHSGKDKYGSLDPWHMRIRSVQERPSPISGIFGTLLSTDMFSTATASVHGPCMFTCTTGRSMRSPGVQCFGLFTRRPRHGVSPLHIGRPRGGFERA